MLHKKQIVAMAALCATALLANAQTERRAGDSAQSAKPVFNAFWARVAGTRLNVRTYPDANSLIVAKVERGTILRVVGGQFGWYEVLAPRGTFARVHADYVETGPDQSGRVRIASGKLRVRAGSAVVKRDPLKAAVLTLLHHGARVRVLGREGDWLRITPPEGVRFHVAAQFTERMSDDDALLALAALNPEDLPLGAPKPEETVTVADARPEGAAKPAAPPPLKIDLSGRWGRELLKLETRIEAESDKSVADQEWKKLIADLRPLSAQRTEPVVTRLAAAWIVRLDDRLADQALIEKARRVARRGTAGRDKSAAPPPTRNAARDYAARGVLLPSYAFRSTEKYARYRLRNPISGMAAAYIEIPVGSKIDPRPFLRKYVGVRGASRFEPIVGVEVVRVTAIEELRSAAPAERRTRQPTPKRVP